MLTTSADISLVSNLIASIVGETQGGVVHRYIVFNSDCRHPGVLCDNCINCRDTGIVQLREYLHGYMIIARLDPL